MLLKDGLSVPSIVVWSLYIIMANAGSRIHPLGSESNDSTTPTLEFWLFKDAKVSHLLKVLFLSISGKRNYRMCMPIQVHEIVPNFNNHFDFVYIRLGHDPASYGLRHHRSSTTSTRPLSSSHCNL